MNKSILLLPLCFAVLLWTCKKSDDPGLTYPTTFTFDNLEIGSSHYFVVQNQAPVQISASGNFTQFEPYLMDEISLEYLDFPVDEFVLLSDSEIQLHIINQGGAPLDTVLNYIEIGNTLRIILDVTNDYFIELEYDSQQNQLKYCVQSSLHSYIDFQNEVNYLLEVEQCSSEDIATLASNVMQFHSLENNDSIAINNSYLVYE